MFEEEYRKEMSQVKLSREQKERITELMTEAPARRIRRTGRMALARGGGYSLVRVQRSCRLCHGSLQFFEGTGRV